MNSLQQVNIVDKKSHQNYLKDFSEELLNFQEYVNYELGRLYDEKHTIISVNFLNKKTVVIVYAMKI